MAVDKIGRNEQLGRMPVLDEESVKREFTHFKVHERARASFSLCNSVLEIVARTPTKASNRRAYTGIGCSEFYSRAHTICLADCSGK